MSLELANGLSIMSFSYIGELDQSFGDCSKLDDPELWMVWTLQYSWFIDILKRSSCTCQYLETCIERTPDMYLQELQDELSQARGVHISVATIRRSLHWRGFSRKQVSGTHLWIFPLFMGWKISRPALECNEEWRAEYQIMIAENYRPEQLVFLDKAACNRNMTTWDYGWAPINGRARRHDYFIRGTWYEFINISKSLSQHL